MTHRIRHQVKSLLPALALLLSLAPLPSQAQEDDPQAADPDEVWSVMMVVNSTPDSFELAELYVVPCGAPDWK